METRNITESEKEKDESMKHWQRDESTERFNRKMQGTEQRERAERTERTEGKEKPAEKWSSQLTRGNQENERNDGSSLKGRLEHGEAEEIERDSQLSTP